MNACLKANKLLDKKLRKRSRKGNTSICLTDHLNVNNIFFFCIINKKTSTKEYYNEHSICHPIHYSSLNKVKLLSSSHILENAIIYVHFAHCTFFSVYVEKLYT
jgi:hypothetical protein